MVLIAVVVVAVTHTVSTYLIKWLTYLVRVPPTAGCICCPLLVLAPHGLCIFGECMLFKWRLKVEIVGVVLIQTCWHDNDNVLIIIMSVVSRVTEL